MSLSDKLALVTGASRGIGKAIAEALGKEGVTVIGTATTDAGAQGITDNFSSSSIKGTGIAMNIADPESVKSSFEKINNDFGSPVIVVNNAGITRDNLMLRMKEDEWNDVINTNLNSLFHITKASLKGMTKARWGRVINIGSVVGSLGNLGQANYAAAKAGLSGYSKSLAREVASRNITVNVIAPGFIETDMTKVLPDEHKEALLTQVPAGRLGSPEEIASTVVFLASDAAAYITGSTIHVNGGMYMD